MEHEIEIWRDESCDSPLEYLDEDVKLVILHRYRQNPSPECGRTPDEVEAWLEENRDWKAIPVFAYEHGNIIFRAADRNPFNCRWDSGRIGTIMFRMEAWEGRDLQEIANRILDNYSDWCNGECYGYTIRKGGEDSEPVTSCGGFFGYEAAERAARESVEVIMKYASND